MLKITQAELIQSATSIKNAPKTNLPEFVMLGRSNVGKSTLINGLCNRKKLAYTSKTPGKTRLINLYNINNEFVLTDLPGYGYAKRSKDELERWKKQLEGYLKDREEIISAIQLVDARHEIQPNDYQMMEWVQYYEIPMFIVLTKTDYLKRHEIQAYIQKIETELGITALGFSGKTKQGKEEILKHLESILKPR